MTPNEFILLAKHQPDAENWFSPDGNWKWKSSIKYHKMIRDEIIVFVGDYHVISFDFEGRHHLKWWMKCMNDDMANAACDALAKNGEFNLGEYLTTGRYI